MDNETLEVADERIMEARVALANSTAALEDRVANTVQTATVAVDETKDLVKNTVNELTEGTQKFIDKTIEKLKSAFDIREQVRNHPWPGVLTAMGTGFLASYLFRRVSAAKVVSGSRPIGKILDVLQREMLSVGETAITSVSSTLKGTVKTLMDDVAAAAAPHVKNFQASGNGREKAPAV